MIGMRAMGGLLALAAAGIAGPGSVRDAGEVPPSPRCIKASIGLVSLAGGETVIGDDRGHPEERPAIATRIAAFRIAPHEVTNAEFAAFVLATGHVTTAERRGDSIVFAPPPAGALPVAPARWWTIVSGADWQHPEGPGSTIAGRAHHPVVHVSLHDALAYAKWKGARLPSEAEFEFAARAGAPKDGAQPEPDAANTWQGPFPRANLLADGHAGSAPVGCYRPNPYGLQDLIGNVWEWTSTAYAPGHLPGPEPLALMGTGAGASGADLRVIKGGSFLCAANYCARYRPAARHAQQADETASHLGFRIAADATSL